ncbi:MAG: hypothetical protein KatS3mg057_0058 [Herpetosiphonaceae bacterium]|nr:MAG: hypothetical protein KatS3mg057_0058 [Herpetosiphonaceae bacterium]
MRTLTSAQRQYLKKLAHHLQPIVQLGKNGLTPQLLHSIDQTLDAHELIKLKFLEFQDEKKEISRQIAEQTNSELVGVIGNIAIFYREQPDPDKRKINLPAPRQRHAA